MKRFYAEVGVTALEGGHGIALDGRPVRTPAREPLRLPTRALAEAVAAEWAAQGEKIDPAAMPMTGLANAAIDRIAPDIAGFASGIAPYGESDLLCYRADGPAALVERQAAHWQPLLDWASARYGVRFATTQGIVHVAQPGETLAALAGTVAAQDAFSLAALSTLVTLSGSLVIGLAVVEQAFPVDMLWSAAELDEEWQVEQWGEDAEAIARSLRRAGEFNRAAAFCALARG